MPQGQMPVITRLKFSMSGEDLLVTTDNSVHIMDAFDGNIKQTFTPGNVPGQGVALDATFSPDAQFVLSGAGDEEEGAKARDKEDGRTHPRAVARSRRAAGRATHALVAAAMARCECRGFGVGGKEGTKRSRLKVQKNTATPHYNRS